MNNTMYGHLPELGMYGGFQPAGPSMGIMHPERGAVTRSEQFDKLGAIQRGELKIDQDGLAALVVELLDIQRGITTSTSGFPVRENLEAPAMRLSPTDTPLRNLLPRIGGSGTASAWRQLTSFGGGFGFQTTVTTGATSATQTVGDTGGMRAGDVLYFATAAVSRTISSITNSTTVVLTASATTTTAETVTNTSLPAGAGVGSLAQLRTFFAETAAPASHVSAYASKSASYKLLGTYFDISGLAMAAGATYQNQREVEKTNALINLMLNEENALINSSSTATTAPWGDGTTALGFDGLINLATTGNGTPTAQVQTSVGALTFAHVDAQIRRLWEQGGENLVIVCSPIESLSLAHLADATGSILRIVQEADGLRVGKRVKSYVHPNTGDDIPILTSRFLTPGTMLFVALNLPGGQVNVDVSVLPQVQLPAFAPGVSIQGYTTQDLAPTITAPQVYPGIISVFEVLRMKSALHICKSTGITAV